MKVEVLCVGAFQVNCAVVLDEDSGQAAVIDPGDEAPRILEAVHELGATVTAILLTHAHLDHVLGVAGVAEATGAPVLLHPADLPLYSAVAEQGRAFMIPAEPGPPPDGELAAGQIVDVGSIRLRVLHTPGHSPGSVSFLLDGAGRGLVFPGDALFARGIGRTDLPGGDYRTLMTSIRSELLALDPTTRVIPGHGPETTIGEEARFNPFLAGGVH